MACETQECALLGRNLLARDRFPQHNPPHPDGAGLAQLVERQFCKLDVASSILATGTIIVAQLNENK